MQNLRAKHAFLGYASEFWLKHTVDLGRKSRAWKVFIDLVTQDRAVAVKPWTADKLFMVNDPMIALFAVENEHLGVLRLLAAGPMTWRLLYAAQASPSFFEVYLTEGGGLSLYHFRLHLDWAFKYDNMYPGKRLFGLVFFWEDGFDTTLRYHAITNSVDSVEGPIDLAFHASMAQTLLAIMCAELKFTK